MKKGRTGFKAQKDNCIYGIDAEGANISFFVFLIIFLFNNDDLAAFLALDRGAEVADDAR